MKAKITEQNTNRKMKILLVITITVLIALSSIGLFAISLFQNKSMFIIVPVTSNEFGSSSSLNWAGYAVLASPGSVYSVNGSWTVPNVSPSKGSTYVAFWVGIDGYNSNTVEQTGILVQSQSGKVSYSAWYEFYPSPPVYAPSSDVVKPGDLIVAWVVYNSDGTFTTVIKDLTENWIFISPATVVSNAQRNSAEWIVERPAIGGSLTKLANFGTVYYGYNYTSISGTCYANVNGVYAPISSFNYVSITMVNYNGKVLASPSGLTSDGTSFYVQYG